MTYASIESIQTVQLDHSSRCNLECPQCGRTTEMGRYPIRDLTVKDYEIIFEPFIGKDIRIFHCGGYGDVVASPTFNETLEWCLSKGFTNISMHTNGSARKPEWWKDLAEKGVQVTFSVDGLGDTNHLYRVNSNFETIQRNMEAYIAAGGNATWNYLVFDHNEHQVDEAKALATRMNFKKFNIKNTGRFRGRQVFNKNNEEIKAHDENNSEKTFKEVIKDYGDFKTYTKLTSVDCKYKKMNFVYIDMEMKLWPCCWIGVLPYMREVNLLGDHDRLMNMYGKDFNRLDIHGWENILSHEFYKDYLIDSWQDPEKRFYTCGKTCGNKYEHSAAYGNNIKTIELKK
jgi:sulfatase maturation enzyme AslB (radical SAM superfamily)